MAAIVASKDDPDATNVKTRRAGVAGRLPGGEALGEGLQVDRAAAVRPLADLVDAVMRFDREQHAAARDLKDLRSGDDRTSDRSRREMAHIDFTADGHPARRQMRRRSRR